MGHQAMEVRHLSRDDIERAIRTHRPSPRAAHWAIEQLDQNVVDHGKRVAVDGVEMSARHFTIDSLGVVAR
jgi:hypothetical protein